MSNLKEACTTMLTLTIFYQDALERAPLDLDPSSLSIRLSSVTSGACAILLNYIPIKGRVCKVTSLQRTTDISVDTLQICEFASAISFYDSELR